MRYIVLLLGGLWLGFSPQTLSAASPVTLDQLRARAGAAGGNPGARAGRADEDPRPRGAGGARRTICWRRSTTRFRFCSREVAGYKLNVANKQATDDVDLQFADGGLQSGQRRLGTGESRPTAKMPGTVPDAEVVRLELEATKMLLSIEKATKDLTVAKLQAQVAEAELDGGQSRHQTPPASRRRSTRSSSSLPATSASGFRPVSP